MKCGKVPNRPARLGNNAHRFGADFDVRPRRRASPLSALVLALVPAALGAVEAPVVDSLTASPATVAPGETVVLAVEAHDPDCPDVCTSGCGQYVRADLTFWEADGGTFTAEDDGVSSSPYSATATWQAPADEATYTLTVFLSDSGSFLCGGRQSTSASVTVLVTSTTNQPPTIESLTASPAQIFPGGTSELACIASDPDGDPVTYSWETDAGTVTAGEGGAAVFTAGEPALAAVTCTAADPAGAFASETVLVSVTGAVAEEALDGELLTPQRLAVDAMGDVYVADRRGGGVTVLHLESGELVYRLPVPGIASVAVDWNGDLVVGGKTGARVVSRRGDPVRALDPGAALGEVSDVAVDPVGRRYGVLYRSAGRVVVHSESGAVVAAFGSTGDGADQLRSPQGLAATPAGDWVVADLGSGRLKVFDLAGALLASFGGRGGGAGEFVQLDDVAVDAAGLLYASDSFQDWVQVWNPDGTLREVLGTYGGDVGRFKTAAGVASADAFGFLLAASLNGPSVQVFRTRDDGAPIPAPEASLSAAALVFPSQAVGVASPPQSVVLTNAGGAPLGVRRVTASGDFAQANDCGAFLDPGAACAFAVTLTPAAAGPRSGSLEIDTSAGRLAVALSGDGFVPPGVSFSPAQLNFSDQELGTSSEPKTVVLTNTGTVPLLIGSLTAGGDDYAQTNDCGPSLAAGARCRIQVTFIPQTVADEIPGSLAVVSNAPGSPHALALDGRGIEDPAHAGPPTVTAVASDGGELETCRPAREAIHRILVGFSEPMRHSQEDPQPGDANHPASYLLLGAGTDQRFDTGGCGAALGDDQPVSLDPVTYDPATSTATLEVAGNEALPASLYRLFVCAGSPGVRDLAGDPLDGDGDGSGGDDFALTFRSDHPNLFANGHFDCDLEGWSRVSVFESEIEHSPEDADGSDLSGSVHFVPLTPEAIGIGQCLPVEPRRVYRLAASFRWSNGDPGRIGHLVASCEVFAGAECSGPRVDEDTLVLTLVHPPSGWASLDNTLETPDGSRSALCSFALSAQPDLEANLDRLLLREDVVLFADGFESGDLGAWSQAAGR